MISDKNAKTKKRQNHMDLPFFSFYTIMY